MPYLHLDDAFARDHVLAAMLFPRDGKKREEYVALAQDRVAVEADSPRHGYMLQAWRTSYLPGEGKRHAFILGPMAGEVLLIIRMMVEHHRKHEASVSKAAYVVAEGISRNRITTPDGGKVPKHPDDVRKEAWDAYREVAHLWAAYSLIRQLAHRLTNSPEEALKEALRLFAERLDCFLAVAENMRRFGEGHTTRYVDTRTKAKQPVLPPEDTWKVPPGYPLPSVAFPIPPLSPEALRDLECYKRS